MMRLPEILAVDRPAEGQVVLTLSLPGESAVFAAHFPGQPILPGVVQLDWAIRLADRYLGTGQRVACDFQVKFRRVIPPESPVTLTLRLDAARRLDLEYRIGEEIAATGRIALGARP